MSYLFFSFFEKNLIYFFYYYNNTPNIVDQSKSIIIKILNCFKKIVINVLSYQWWSISHNNLN